jgi:hypothetical protein
MHPIDPDEYITNVMLAPSLRQSECLHCIHQLSEKCEDCEDLNLYEED